MSGLTLTIPKNGPYQSIWYNNIIAAIFYSQYSREILKKDYISKEIHYIYKFSQPTAYILDNYIRIASSANPLKTDHATYQLNYFDNDITDLKISLPFYHYLEKNNKQLIAFILPKFLEFIKSSCVSIERYNGKNYIGMNDMVDYVKNNYMGLFNEFKLKQIKKSEIKLKYTTVSDYILINKWNNLNKPKIFDEITKLDQPGDDVGIDNKYRLSSIYKNEKDLNITDEIQERIIFNDYYYILDSFIITTNDDKPYSKLITSLTYNKKKYLYIEHKDCDELNELKSLTDEFKIYSSFPCNLFKGKIDQNEATNLSVFNLTTGCNYTLIYVKYKKITDEEREIKREEDRKKAEQKREEDRRKAEQKARQDEEKEKHDKFSKLENLEKEIIDKDAKIKELQDIYGKNHKQHFDEIEKIITFTSNKPNYKNLKKILQVYINILKTNQTEFKTHSFEDWVKKIYEIKEEINNNNQKYQIIEAKPAANKNKEDKDYLDYYDNIILYLNRYIFFIINLISRQNAISLIQEQIKDLPDNKKINDVLDAISKLPDAEQFKQLNDLLTPTDAKIDQILDTISKLPNDAKLNRIEILLTPTDAKLNQILDAIAKIPKEDYTKIIQDAIAKMPKQDYKKIVEDAIAKMPKEDNKKLIEDLNAKMDVMQQELIQKIQEQKAVARSRSKDNITIQPEIDDLKKQLQLMGDIQKQLSDATRMDHTKIVQDLNLKLDTMQQELLGKIKEIREIKKSSSSSIKDNITLQSEIVSLNQQLQLLGDIQKKLSETGERDNKQLLADMQKELLKYSHKDNELIIKGVQDLLRSFNENIILKQNEKDIKIHKEHLLLLKDIKLQLDKNVKNSNSSSKSKKDDKETELLKLENTELKKQIEILKDIQMKCERQQKDYERCNKHNMLPYKYIKFKEDELLDAIREQFKSKNSKPSDKIIIEFIFQYFEKNNKVMNLYIIEKYMGDIYDVMKIFNKKYNIERVNIKQFYRLLASISIYAKFNDKIKKIFIK